MGYGGNYNCLTIIHNALQIEKKTNRAVQNLLTIWKFSIHPSSQSLDHQCYRLHLWWNCCIWKGCTVEQQIFVCRKYSRISQNSWDSRKFHAHEFFLLFRNSRKFHARELPDPQIRKNFMTRKFPVLQYLATIWAAHQAFVMVSIQNLRRSHRIPMV